MKADGRWALPVVVAASLMSIPSRASAPPGPDLTVEKVTVSSVVVTSTSVTFKVSATLSNTGKHSASGIGWSAWLSSNALLEASKDTLAFSSSSSVTLAASRTVVVTGSAVVSPPPSGGTYYVLVKVDPSNTISEEDELNNVRASGAFSLSGSGPGPGGGAPTDVTLLDVDLRDLDGLSTREGTLGQEAQLRVTLKNQGTSAIPAFQVGVVLSSDASLNLGSDFIFHDEPVSPMAAGQARTVTFTLTLPTTDKFGRALATGDYYLFGYADSFNDVVEGAAEDNNTLLVDGPVRLSAPAPDYAALSVAAPARVAAGEVVSVERLLQNLGSADGAPVQYTFYASVNDILSPGDFPLAVVSAHGEHASRSLSLKRGERSAAPELVRLPADLPPGAYYIGVLVDGAQQVAELDELNNAAITRSPVQVGAPALQVLTAGIPDAHVGRDYQVQLVATGARAAISWSLVPGQGELPPGLTLSPSGWLTGQPTEPSTSIFTVRAESGQEVAVGRAVMRVLPPTSELSVRTQKLPPLVRVAGQRYEAALAAGGGVRPYLWRLTGGALPSGLTMSEAGVVAGALVAAVPLGERVLAVEVKDAVGSVARAEVALRVVDATSLLIDATALPSGRVGTDYLIDLPVKEASGATLAHETRWRLASGGLPPGLALSTLEGRGLLRGVPLRAGSFPFSLQVEDDQGRVDEADFVISVFAQRTRLKAVDLPDSVHPGDELRFHFVLEGERGAVLFRLYDGALPPGVSLSEAGIVEGTVIAEAAPRRYEFIVEARAATGTTGFAPFSLELSRPVEQRGCGATPGSVHWLGSAMSVLALLALRRRR